MTDQQFREHVRLLEAIQGETRGVQQEVARLVQIANKNLQVNGESKEVLGDILRALDK